jgi:hypothetical protein
MIQKIYSASIRKCVISGDKNLKTIFKLPDYPLTEQFGKYESNFPNVNQELLISLKSGHVQLKNIINQKFLYNDKNYNFQTKVNYKKNHDIKTFVGFIKNLKIKKIKSILDVGGNDSYIISQIGDNNSAKFIIDPVGKKNEKNIKVINKFLEEIDFKKNSISPDLVICRHTLEHIPDPIKFLNILMKNTKENCKFVFEVPSLEFMLEKKRFDTIIHQHISYFDLESLKFLLAKVGCAIKKFFYFNEGSCSGSLIFYFEKKKNVEIPKIEKKKIIKKYNNIIKAKNLYDRQIKDLRNAINEENNKIYGYGAGMMLATFFYYLKINHKHMIIFDDEKKKNGKSYKNINVKIKTPNKKNLKKNLPFLITSLENQRAILKKILNINPKKIFVQQII